MNFLLPLLVGGPDIISSDIGILILFTTFPIVYYNADSQKKQIYLDNKEKSGIYMWVNTVNNKKYVGSFSNLQRRFSAYYSVAYLTKYNTITIHRALLKYGYSAFSLHILEYCSKEDLITREQYYIDLYKPDYNILRLAGSSLGFKQSEEWKVNNILGQPNCMEVIVTDLHTNISTSYDSIGLAARALGINDTVISRYFSRNQKKKPYKGRYTFKLG